MQLATLLASKSAIVGPHNERAMLTMHIFYLGAVILLYGQPLVAAEEAGLDVETPEVLHYQSTCLVAGEQISRFMNAVNSTPSRTPQTWILM
jgi:hypothetical protein